MSEISDLTKRGKNCGVRQGLALLIVYPFGKTDTNQPISKSCTMNAWSPSVTLIPLSWRHGRLTVSSSNVPTFVQTMSPRPFPLMYRMWLAKSESMMLIRLSCRHLPPTVVGHPLLLTPKHIKHTGAPSGHDTVPTVPRVPSSLLPRPNQDNRLTGVNASP